MPWNNSWSMIDLRTRGGALASVSQLYAPHVTPPHWIGAFMPSANRGRGPSGAGWLVAIVCVRGSEMTIGAHSDMPQRRVPSRSQTAWTSLKNSSARC
jgi:hypothetical protein